MTVAELQEAKRLGYPVILKATPPRTYRDAKYRRVLAIVMRKIERRLQPVAILEDYCGRSVVYAEPRHITREDSNT